MGEEFKLRAWIRYLVVGYKHHVCSLNSAGWMLKSQREVTLAARRVHSKFWELEPCLGKFSKLEEGSRAEGRGLLCSISVGDSNPSIRGRQWTLVHRGLDTLTHEGSWAQVEDIHKSLLPSALEPFVVNIDKAEAIFHQLSLQERRGITGVFTGEERWTLSCFGVSK